MPDTYADQYADALHPRRYAADDREPPSHDTDAIRGLASALTEQDRHPAHSITVRRGMLADALDEAGDGDTAAMVRDASNHIVYHDGRVQRGKFQYGTVTHHDGDYYDDALQQQFDDEGPEGAAEYLQQWDHGHARPYYDEPSWGSADRTHEVSLLTGRRPFVRREPYVVYHNPRMGYAGLEHIREVPHDTPSGDRG